MANAINLPLPITSNYLQVNANSLLGNPTGSPSTGSNILLGTTLGFSGSTLQTNALSGDVTSSANSFVTTVAKINGAALGSTTATSGNLLIGDGTQWVSNPLSGDASLTSGGVFTIANNAITTPKINNNAVTYAKFQQIGASSLVGNATGATANATDITLGATLGFSGSALQTNALSGDVTSSANSFVTTVAKINGATLGSTTATSGNLLIGDGTQWVSTTMIGDASILSNGTLTLTTVNPSSVGTFGSATQVGQFTVNAKGLITAASNVTISGVSPGGAAGGDLSGTYPNPTVAKINGATLGSTTATSGNLLIGDGTQWVSTAMGGDANILSNGTLTIANNAITTAKIAANAVDLTTKVSGILPIANGGTNISTYTLGDTLYASAANTLSKLAGNITTTKQYLSQTGTGAISAAPTWSTISGTDITGAALTSVNDTNITLTLGGTPATALLRAASITAGWSGQLSAARGGTGIGSYTVGDLLYASGATTLSTLADVATGNALISGGVGVAPSWGKISLTTTVSGILPVANGGTGLNAGVSGGIPYFSSTSSMASSAALAANGIVIGGGPSIAPQANSDFTYIGGFAQLNTTNIFANWTIKTTNVSGGNEASLTLERSGVATGFAQVHFSSAGTEDWAVGTRFGSSNFTFFNTSENYVPYTFSKASTKYEFIVSSNITGSVNESALTVSRGDLANGYASLYFQTGGATNWIIQTQAGVSDLAFYNTVSGSSALSILTTGRINIPILTASQLVLTDASKNLVSAATLSPTLGGTGVNNGSNTITLGGNFTTSGANALTLTTTGATNVTLPTSGTLATTSQITTWSATGTSITLTVNTGTITTGASLVTLTLPASPAVGSVFYVAGQGAGGWKIAQVTNQIIHCGNVDTTLSTGNLASTNRYDCVMLVCVANGATIEFTAVSMVGNLNCV